MNQNHPRVEKDNFDPHIVPAETAARKEREAQGYKHPPKKENEGIDTDGGYTVDQEGLVNNYPIEPEMYIEEPGDLRDQQDANQHRRVEELQRANQTDESGKVTIESDQRGKGVGQI
jgi:hypothetical protein